MRKFVKLLVPVTPDTIALLKPLISHISTKNVSQLAMGLLAHITERRLVPIMVAYLVAGYVGVEIVSQLVELDILPTVAIRISLIIYFLGVGNSLVYAWSRGAPGRQPGSRLEMGAHAVIVIAAVIWVSMLVYQTREPDTATITPGTDPRNIAVLHLQPGNPSEELSAIASGMTAELIAQLARVPALTVISENGTEPYANLNLPATQIAQELQVGSIVSGDVFDIGDRFSFTVRLQDGESGVVIDRANAELSKSEFFANRQSVVENVANLLRQRLGEEIRLQQSRESSSNLDSWLLVQRANALRSEAERNFDSGVDLDEILGLLEQADQLLLAAESSDPEWTLIDVARANIAYRKAWFKAGAGNLNAAQEDIEAGIEITNEILDVAPFHAEALNQRGTLRMLALAAGIRIGDSDQVPAPETVESDLAAAVRSDPNLASAYSMLSFYYSGLGDEIETALSARRALEADAYLQDADRIFDRLIFAYYNLGELREALEWCEEGYRRFPENPRFTECRLMLMASPIGEADIDEAIELLNELQEKTPPSLRQYKYAVGQIMVAAIHHMAGLTEEAEDIYDDIESSELIDPQNQLTFYEAQFRSISGDVSGALDTLRRREAIVGDIRFDRNDLSWVWQNLTGNVEFENYLTPE